MFYERNKQQLLSNWEDRLAKSLIYVAVVLLLYILLVVITIIHDTYSVSVKKKQCFHISFI